jgi:hypothetical protein
MAPHGFVEGFAALFGIRFALIYFAGGLDHVFQIWLAKVTSPERRGVIFGWGATAKALGISRVGLYKKMKKYGMIESKPARAGVQAKR